MHPHRPINKPLGYSDGNKNRPNGVHHREKKSECQTCFGFIQLFHISPPSQFPYENPEKIQLFATRLIINDSTRYLQSALLAFCGETKKGLTVKPSTTRLSEASVQPNNNSGKRVFAKEPDGDDVSCKRNNLGNGRVEKRKLDPSYRIAARPKRNPAAQNKPEHESKPRISFDGTGDTGYDNTAYASKKQKGDDKSREYPEYLPKYSHPFSSDWIRFYLNNNRFLRSCQIRLACGVF